MKHVVRQRMRRVVLLTMKDASTFRGVLFDADAEAFVLRNVEHLREKGAPLTVDGELVVLVRDVAYLQFV